MASCEELAAVFQDLCRQQRQRWLEGDRMLVEALVAGREDLAGDEQGMLDLIYSEFCLREQLQGRPDPEEYLRRFPRLAEPLRNQFEVHNALEANSLPGCSESSTNGIGPGSACAGSLAKRAGGWSMASADEPASQPAKDKWLLVDACVQRFEKAWQSSGRPAIDDFLPQDGSDRLAVLKELVKVDMERRVADGEPARAEDYLERFPELAAYLHPTQVVESTPQQPAIAGRAASPQQIGRYRVERILGQGGFGIVYLAHDDQLSRPVAIKVPHAKLVARPDDSGGYLNLFEARAVAIFDHPNIVPVHDIGSTEDYPCFFVSKFIEGGTLSQKIKEGRPSFGETAELVKAIAEALHYAHGKGLVHRDIKPGNILLDKTGKPYVADFGLALKDENVGHGPKYAGTPAYMSPEQARGEGHRVDGRTDVFSLGVVFYELLTGRRPFKGESVDEVLEQITTFEPRPPRQWDDTIPKELERICLKALSKRASERYTTAKDMADDLRHFLRDAGRGVRDEEIEETGGAPHLSPLADRGSEGGSRKSDLRPPTSDLRPPISSQPRRSLQRLVGVIAVGVLIGVIGVPVYFLTRGGNRPLPGHPADEAKLFEALAVLPFENVGGDPETEHLSDGIPESIVQILYEVRSLKVRPFSSVARYKGRGKNLDLQEVGRQLKVQAVLTGKLTQRKDGLSLSVELVDVRDHSGIWIDRYDRKRTDTPRLPQDIAKQVCVKLGLQLTGEEQKRLTKRSTDNSEAYYLYTKGRYFYVKFSEEAIKKGIDYFNQAIDKDPTYALAYAGLADSYVMLVNYGFVAPKEAMPQAKAAARKALDIDEKLAEAQTSLASINERYDWNWSDAEQGHARAIALNPNYPRAHVWYAYYLGDRQRFEDSLAESRRAEALDPVSLMASATVGWAFYYARQYDEAIAHCQKTLEIEARFWVAHDYMARAYFQKEKYDDAIAAFQKAKTLSPGTPVLIAELGYSHAVAGNKREAQLALEELRELSKRKYVPAFWFAFVYSGLGEKDQAFEWLEKAYKERSPVFAYLEAEPMFDGLRSDPRVSDLLRRIGK